MPAGGAAPAALQTPTDVDNADRRQTTDTSVQNNTGPLGESVITNYRLFALSSTYLYTVLISSEVSGSSGRPKSGLGMNNLVNLRALLETNVVNLPSYINVQKVESTNGRTDGRTRPTDRPKHNVFTDIVGQRRQ